VSAFGVLRLVFQASGRGR